MTADILTALAITAVLAVVAAVLAEVVLRLMKLVP